MAPKGSGPQNFEICFPSPATFFPSLSWGSLRGILVVFLKRRGPEMCTHRLVLGVVWSARRENSIEVLCCHQAFLFGAQPFGAQPFGAQPFGARFFLGLGPTLWGHDTHQIQKWIGQKWIGAIWIGQTWSNQDGPNGIGQSQSLPRGAGEGRRGGKQQDDNP